MQRSSIFGPRVNGKRPVADSVRTRKFSGPRTGPSFQAKAQERFTDECPEPAEKRKTPLSDRIARAAAVSGSEQTADVPALENLRRVLFE